MENEIRVAVRGSESWVKDGKRLKTWWRLGIESSVGGAFMFGSIKQLGTWVGYVFAAIGLWASIIGLYDHFAPKKTINASYRTKVVAESANAFDIHSFIKEEYVGSKQVVAVDVIMWNSGGESISADDVRPPLEIRVDKGSVVHERKLGVQKASVDNNYTLESIDDNTFKLTWKYFDPGDFFEVHLLVL
jgi:hypothetical protein